jgi:hypothetical protein
MKIKFIIFPFPWMNQDLGTLKYQSQWSVFDQIMVSGNLLKPKINYLPGLNGQKSFNAFSSGKR